MLDERNREYVDGFAIHWYGDELFGLPNAMDITHDEFPNKFMLYTEACTGDKEHLEPVKLGDWKRGELYLDNIIEDLNHWVTGWTDWNLALDMGVRALKNVKIMFNSATLIFPGWT